MGTMAIVRGTVDWPCYALNVHMVVCCRSNRNPDLGVGFNTIQICAHSVSLEWAMCDYS